MGGRDGSSIYDLYPVKRRLKDHPVRRVLNDMIWILSQRPSGTESIEAFSPSYDLAPLPKTIPYREY
jgi:hypothetical protein